MKNLLVRILFCGVTFGLPFKSLAQSLISPFTTASIFMNQTPQQSLKLRTSAGFEYKMDSVIRSYTEGVAISKTIFNHISDGTVKYYLTIEGLGKKDSVVYNYISGKKSEVLYYNRKNNIWVISGSNQYIYEGEYLKVYENKRYDDDIFLSGNTKTQYEYNTSGNIKSSSTLEKFNSEGAWQPYYKEEYYYNSKTLLDSLEKYYWNNLENEYSKPTVTKYSYNGKGELVNYSTHSISIDYLYDANSNLLSSVNYMWDTPNNTRKQENKSDFKFSTLYNRTNTSVSFDDEVYELFKNGAATHVTNFAWDIKVSSWKVYNEVKLYYSKLNPTAIIEKYKSAFNIYPNPASGSLNIVSDIDFADKIITIRNLLGEEVIHETRSGINNEISLNGLSAGTYFLYVGSNGKIHTEKLIIK